MKLSIKMDVSSKSLSIKLSSREMKDVWSKGHNVIVFETADLDTYAGAAETFENVEVLNTTTGVAKKFVFSSTDYGPENEVLGRWFVSETTETKLLFITNN